MESTQQQENNDVTLPGPAQQQEQVPVQSNPSQDEVTVPVVTEVAEAVQTADTEQAPADSPEVKH